MAQRTRGQCPAIALCPVLRLGVKPPGQGGGTRRSSRKPRGRWCRDGGPGTGVAATAPWTPVSQPVLIAPCRSGPRAPGCDPVHQLHRGYVPWGKWRWRWLNMIRPGGPRLRRRGHGWRGRPALAPLPTGSALGPDCSRRPAPAPRGPQQCGVRCRPIRGSPDSCAATPCRTRSRPASPGSSNQGNGHPAYRPPRSSPSPTVPRSPWMR